MIVYKLLTEGTTYFGTQGFSRLFFDEDGDSWIKPFLIKQRIFHVFVYEDRL